MSLQEKFTKYLISEGFVYSDLTLTSCGDYLPKDAEWNYSDVPHLNYVHTKANAENFLVEDQFISSLIMQDFLFLKKIPILVNNFHTERDHHTYCFQFLFFFVIVETNYFIENNKTIVRTRYRIFSKPILKLFHYFIKLSLKKNYLILMSEDIPMRNQRGDLRKMGYQFSTDKSRLIGYKQTVDITKNNLIFPPKIRTGKAVTFDLIELEQSKHIRVSNGINELILYDSGDQICIFPGYCPHEGAPLEIPTSRITVTCPWHGKACKPLFSWRKDGNKPNVDFQHDQFDVQILLDKLILNM